jgi:hypothetical protein
VGTVVIQRLQQEAAKANLPIRSTVFRFNPGSLRFHQRLGFHIVREEETQFHLEWRPIAWL